MACERAPTPQVSMYESRLEFKSDQQLFENGPTNSRRRADIASRLALQIIGSLLVVIVASCSKFVAAPRWNRPNQHCSDPVSRLCANTKRNIFKSTNCYCSHSHTSPLRDGLQNLATMHFGQTNVLCARMLCNELKKQSPKSSTTPRGSPRTASHFHPICATGRDLAQPAMFVGPTVLSME